MLAHRVVGAGPPVLLLHGSLSSGRAWEPVLDGLTDERTVLLPDLPGFGATPAVAGATTPATWVRSLLELLDHVGMKRVAVAGHSMGGWTALELAKQAPERVTAVLALAPAGLWRERSPRLTDLRLQTGRLLGRIGGPLSPLVLQTGAGRALALRDHSGRPREVPAAWALAAAQDASRATGWREHFRAARSTRFRGGQELVPPLRVVFGDRERIAPAGKSQFLDELPADTQVETWPGCGHMLMWDAPERVRDAVLALDR
jgi:pimeloyl-ACP methyl ester carboxylesterase